MKTTNKLKSAFASLLLASLSFSSCDLLIQPPISDLTADNFWKTADDARVGVQAIYAAMGGAMSPGMWNWGELRSDSYTANSKEAFDQLELTTNNILNDNSACLWTSLYQVIGRANVALKYIQPISIAAETKNNYLAEALTLRAWAYFYLVRTWGDVPVFLEPVETLGPNIYRARTDEHYILESVILPDLNKAYQLISKTVPATGVVRTHINPGVLNALLMDVNAWVGNYDKVISIYNERVTLTSVMPTASYGLSDGILASNTDAVNSANWRALFQESGTAPATTNIKEVLFKIGYEKTAASNTNSAVSYFGSSTPRVTPNDYVRNTLFIVGDWRKTASFPITGTPAYRLVNKFWTDAQVPLLTSSTASTRVYSNLDLTLYRYADIVLLYAEALARVDRLSEAVQQLNRISERAKSTTYYVSNFINGDEVVDAILLERHREFLGEGKRWFDLVRCNRVNLVQQHAGINIVMPRQKNIPIHRDHINQNIEKLVQNPY